MIVLAGMILGALNGWFQASRLGGTGKDKAQYAAVHGVIGVILGLVLTIVIDRMTRP
ncbi:MAG: hypothetical protein N2422_11155 [Rhodobacteraceae bacterium]|nr:hypothetical protein [Paracoccaceae bacterium]